VGDDVRFEVNVSLGDYRAAVRRLRQLAKQHMARRWYQREEVALGAVVGLCVGLAETLGWFGIDGRTVALAAVIAVVFVAGLLLVIARSFRAWRLAFEPTTGSDQLGRQAFTLDADGVRCVTQNTDMLVRWAAVLDLQEMPELLLLRIGPTQAFILPRRDLARPGEARVRAAIQGRLPPRTA
jgi:phage shock protein PspC (stress-responsive transcriptional regulator)